MYELISLSHLVQLPPPVEHWVVDQLLPRVGLSMISASPKVGKSTLVRQMAMSVASGTNFLGRTTSKGRVLHALFDDAVRDVQDHYYQLAQTYGAEACDNVHLLPMRVVTDEFREAALVRREVLIEAVYAAQDDGDPYKLIIIDTMIKIMDQFNMLDYVEAEKAMAPLNEMAEELAECHILLVHHSNKASEGTGSGAAALGSQCIRGSTVANLFLWVDGEDRRMIRSEQGRGKTIPESSLSFDTNRGTVDIGMDSDRESLIRVIGTLSEEEHGLPFTTIKKRSGLLDYQVSKAIKHLEVERKVELKKNKYHLMQTS